jgi:hypothetical protein
MPIPIDWREIASGIGGVSPGCCHIGGAKSPESRWKQDRHGTLSLTVEGDGLTEDELTASLQASGYEIRP